MLQPKLTQKSEPSWAWWSTTSTLSKGLHIVCNHLHDYLSGEGASKKNKWLMLTEEALDAYETLKKACREALVLVFAGFNKPFLLKLMEVS